MELYFFVIEFTKNMPLLMKAVFLLANRELIYHVNGSCMYQNRTLLYQKRAVQWRRIVPIY